MSRSIIEAAWCAGYLDGEGCFAAATGPHTLHWRPILRAGSTDQAALERLAECLGGTIHARPARPTRVASWVWYLRPAHSPTVSHDQTYRRRVDARDVQGRQTGKSASRTRTARSQDQTGLLKGDARRRASVVCKRRGDDVTRASIFAAEHRPIVLGNFLVPAWGVCSSFDAMINGIVRVMVRGGRHVPRGQA